MCDYSVLVGKYFLMLNALVLVVFVVHDIFAFCFRTATPPPYVGDPSTMDRAGIEKDFARDFTPNMSGFL